MVDPTAQNWGWGEFGGCSILEDAGECLGSRGAVINVHDDEDSSGLNGWLLGSLDETVSCLDLSKTRSPVNYVSSQRAPVLKLVPDSHSFPHSVFLPVSPTKSSTSTSILPPTHLRSQSPVLPSSVTALGCGPHSQGEERGQLPALGKHGCGCSGGNFQPEERGKNEGDVTEWQNNASWKS